MRLLVLGGAGMLGRQLAETLAETNTVLATVRTDPDRVYVPRGVAAVTLDVRNWEVAERVFNEAAPDAILNAVGIIKQHAACEDAAQTIEVNSLFPRRLARYCGERRIRLLHFSTDCVFSGRTGLYRESDLPDDETLYGRSKLLGEVAAKGVFTLRTSIIGLEARRKTGLVEWFLSQSRSIKGYTRAIFSGLTTIELARVAALVLQAPSQDGGLYHVAGAPISKHDLLAQFRDVVRKRIEIARDDDFECDRSLDGGRFTQRFGYVAPDWGRMLGELGERVAVRERGLQ